MSSLKDPKVKHFMVVDKYGGVLCTDGQMHHGTACGPGGYCARLYKTEGGASRAAAPYGSRDVAEVDQWGAPWVA